MKRSITYLILLCVTTFSYAGEEKSLQQEKIPYLGTKHYLCLNAGGGLHSHMLKADGGDAEYGYGSLFELKYQLTPKNWGIGIGVQISSYRGYTIFNHSYSETFTHLDNDLSYTLNTQFVNWEERQSNLSIEIPFSIQCMKSINKNWSFLLGFGATVSIPIKERYTTQDGYFTSAGWFESTNVVYEDLLNHGFRTVDTELSGPINNMRPGVGAHVEIGFNRAIRQKSAFYMGLYTHYGITSITDPQENSLYDGSNYTGAYESERVEEVHPFKAGVKLGLRFNLRDKKREAEAIRIVEEKQRERERQKEIAASAEQMRRDRLRQEQRERIRREEENDRQMRLEKERIEAYHKAALKEEKEATFALKRIADEAIYTYPNSVPTFPEEIERSFDIIYTYLAKHANARILIVGHTDNTIKGDRSVAIGKKRADAFKQALIRKGIPEDKIECISKGNTQPIASNNTKGGRELNNRTELKLKGGEAEE